MIKSMTGYGKAESTAGDKKITVEVRSLNGKQLDLSVRMPSLYRPFEHEIRNRASKSAGRGKIDIFINVESNTAGTAININRELFLNYYNSLLDLATKGGSNRDSDELHAAVMSAVLRMPDVVSGDVPEVPDCERDALFSAVDSALEHLDSFRLQEGQTLIADLLRRIDLIEDFKTQIVPFENRRVQIIKERIRESIASLALKPDENRLEQEMIFYVEKLDITEEKVRLDNHCNYFREVSREDSSPGRKLGFIAQEIGREINTIGSKANDSDIQHIVVGMKDELEKIKEQVLNIL